MANQHRLRPELHIPQTAGLGWEARIEHSVGEVMQALRESQNAPGIRVDPDRGV